MLMTALGLALVLALALALALVGHDAHKRCKTACRRRRML